MDDFTSSLVDTVLKLGGNVVMLQEIVFVLATSKKGKSRIGKNVISGIVEQNHPDKLFVVFPELNQCRWILKENDPDFRIISQG